MKQLIAGIDIGGTKIAIALATADYEIIAKRVIPTLVSDGANKNLERTLGELEILIEREQAELLKIGIACAGPLDVRRGLILSSPNLPGWDEFPIVETIRRRMKVSVILENDANAAALAEQKFGAGKAFKNLVYVTISTGIGGGIVADGKLIQGLTGNAGEIGHITVMPNGLQCGCGARGCLEAVCSGTGIARRFVEKIHRGESSLVVDKVKSLEQITAKHIAEAAAEGDALAAEIWEETIFYLSVGLGNVIVMFEPEAIILGGGVSLTGEQLLEPLRRQIQHHLKIFSVSDIYILQAGLGAESGIYGALALTLQ